MFDGKPFKRSVRARIKETGERYATARARCIRAILKRAFDREPEHAELPNEGGSTHLEGLLLFRRVENDAWVSVWLDVNGFFVVSFGSNGSIQLIRCASLKETMAVLDRDRAAWRVVSRLEVFDAIDQAEARVRSVVEGRRVLGQREQYEAFLAEQHERTTYNDEGPWMIRPFDKQIVEGVRETMMTGWVIGQQFHLRAADVEILLDTAEVGVDTDGPYALARAGTVPLREGYALVVSCEHDYGMGTDLVLEVQTDFPSARQWRELDIEALELMRPQQSWSVYFDPTGVVNGSGSSMPERRAG